MIIIGGAGERGCVCVAGFVTDVCSLLRRRMGAHASVKSLVNCGDSADRCGVVTYRMIEA